MSKVNREDFIAGVMIGIANATCLFGLDKILMDKATKVMAEWAEMSKKDIEYWRKKAEDLKFAVEFQGEQKNREELFRSITDLNDQIMNKWLDTTIDEIIEFNKTIEE